MHTIGHRGARGLAPENTLESIQSGINAGANMIEIDVRLTADNVPVVIHDNSTKRTHDKAYVVSRHTYAQLTRELVPRIPSLEEVLERYFSKISLNIEVKTAETAPVVARLLSRYIRRPTNYEHILLSSHNIDALRTLRAYSPELRLAYISWLNPFTFTRVDNELSLSAVGFYHRILPSRSIRIAKRRDLMIYVYTVNRPDEMSRLHDRGIDAAVTDF